MTDRELWDEGFFYAASSYAPILYGEELAGFSPAWASGFRMGREAFIRGYRK